jgi:hypothetical protein
MIKSVIACALMMQLSMATKLEMARPFPEVASYCVRILLGRFMSLTGSGLREDHQSLGVPLSHS